MACRLGKRYHPNLFQRSLSKHGLASLLPPDKANPVSLQGEGSKNPRRHWQLRCKVTRVIMLDGRKVNKRMEDTGVRLASCCNIKHSLVNLVLGKRPTLAGDEQLAHSGWHLCFSPRIPSGAVVQAVQDCMAKQGRLQGSPP